MKRLKVNIVGFCIGAAAMASEGLRGQALQLSIERFLTLTAAFWMPREIESPSEGEVISMPHLGGLHHRYARAA